MDVDFLGLCKLLDAFMGSHIDQTSRDNTVGMVCLFPGSVLYLEHQKAAEMSFSSELKDALWLENHGKN